MDELIAEHTFGRKTVKALIKANEQYRNGDEKSLGDITEKLQTLIEFYPKHIEKENKVFFPSTRKYFSIEVDYDIKIEISALFQ